MGVDLLEAQVVGAVVDVEDVAEDVDVDKAITMTHLEGTTLIARWMLWFKSGRSHHRATYREVGLHCAAEGDGRGLDQVRLSEGVRLNEEGVCLSEEEIPLVVG